MQPDVRVLRHQEEQVSFIVPGGLRIAAHEPFTPLLAVVHVPLRRSTRGWQRLWDPLLHVVVHVSLSTCIPGGRWWARNPALGVGVQEVLRCNSLFRELQLGKLAGVHGIAGGLCCLLPCNTCPVGLELCVHFVPCNLLEGQGHECLNLSLLSSVPIPESCKCVAVARKLGRVGKLAPDMSRILSVVMVGLSVAVHEVVPPPASTAHVVDHLDAPLSGIVVDVPFRRVACAGQWVWDPLLIPVHLPLRGNTNGLPPGLLCLKLPIPVSLRRSRETLGHERLVVAVVLIGVPFRRAVRIRRWAHELHCGTPVGSADIVRVLCRLLLPQNACRVGLERLVNLILSNLLEGPRHKRLDLSALRTAPPPERWKSVAIASALWGVGKLAPDALRVLSVVEIGLSIPAHKALLPLSPVARIGDRGNPMASIVVDVPLRRAGCIWRRARHPLLIPTHLSSIGMACEQNLRVRTDVVRGVGSGTLHRLLCRNAGPVGLERFLHVILCHSLECLGDKGLDLRELGIPPIPEFCKRVAIACMTRCMRKLTPDVLGLVHEATVCLSIPADEVALPFVAISRVVHLRNPVACMAVDVRLRRGVSACQ
mmetsp:Transcript_10602/g.24930  ORF Transcript_10602/g.24930 Transcript_10602/m.24930 type:complete len:595 (-) Transcript_10602:1480-3264(-)